MTRHDRQYPQRGTLFREATERHRGIRLDAHRRQHRVAGKLPLHLFRVDAHLVAHHAFTRRVGQIVGKVGRKRSIDHHSARIEARRRRRSRFTDEGNLDAQQCRQRLRHVAQEGLAGELGIEGVQGEMGEFSQVNVFDHGDPVVDGPRLVSHQAGDHADPDQLAALAHIALLDLVGRQLARQQALPQDQVFGQVFGVSDLADRHARQFGRRKAEHLAHVWIAAQKTALLRGVRDSDRGVFERVAVLSFAGLQRRLGRMAHRGGRLQLEEVAGHQRQRRQQHGDHLDEGAGRFFAPVRQRGFPVKVHGNREWVGVGSEVGRQDFFAVVQALLEAAESVVCEARLHKFGPLANPRRLRCTVGKQLGPVGSQPLHRGFGGIENPAVVVDEVFAVHRGQRGRTAAVVQTDIARHRQEAQALRGRRWFGAARAAVVQIPAGPGQADAQYRRRIVQRGQEAVEFHMAPEAAHIRTGDDVAVRIEQRQRAQIGGLVQGLGEFLGRPCRIRVPGSDFGRVDQGQVDDAETLGQLVLERASVQIRCVQGAINGLLAMVQLELHGQADDAEGQGHHLREKDPAPLRLRPPRRHRRSTIVSSLWLRALASGRPFNTAARTPAAPISDPSRTRRLLRVVTVTLSLLSGG